MSTLSKYISDLLFLHNCVIVPELGGFVAEYKSAVIDEQRELVFPPSKSLAFNNILRKNDGLLVNYIAHKRELTYETAATWLSEQVKEIKHTLLTDGLVIVNGLGALYLDENQQFQFRADVEQNLLADAYGLTPVNLPIDLSIRTSKTLKTVPINQNQGVMSKKTMVKVAAVLGPILIIGAIISFGTDFFKKEQGSQTAAIGVTQPKQETIAKDSSDIEEIATQKEQALYYSEKEATYEYHIIAGSYNKRKNAQILADQLVSDGHNARVVEADGKFRVSMQQFSDRYEALQKLDFLRKTTNKSYWLFKQKN